MKQILFTLAAVLSFAVQAQQQRNFDAVQIKTHKITESVYMLEGEGGNIGVSVGEDGVFLIDEYRTPDAFVQIAYYGYAPKKLK